MIGSLMFLNILCYVRLMKVIDKNSSSLVNVYDKNGQLNELGLGYYEIGKAALSQNQFGVVILSGGQGTRLGFDGPKGLFEIAGMSLFEHHVQKIKDSGYSHMIKLFIMTSEHTHDDVTAYFKAKKNFDLNVVFFKQNSFPCTYKDNSLIKLADHRHLTAPNGNGDIFKSINHSDLQDLYAVNVISIDNVLAEILNPEFVGVFIGKRLDVLSKSIPKLENENIGIFTKNNLNIEVKEYSELQDNEKIYNCEGNICNHLFKTEFIKRMKYVDLPIHKACKKIPTDIKKQIDRPEEDYCLKSEYFIFDAFTQTERHMILSVPRNKEFAPLKNSINSKSDNPKTCTQAYYKKQVNVK